MMIFCEWLVEGVNSIFEEAKFRTMIEQLP